MKHLRVALAAAAVLAFPTCVHATHGYFAYGYGTQAKGMGGAGVALPLDSVQAAVNPAGMVYLGNRFDVGAGLFSIRPQYKVTGNPSGAAHTFPLVPESVSGKRDFILAPNAGWNHMIDPRGSVGVSIYTNGGANTKYPASAGGGRGSFYAGPTGVKLKQLFIQPSYSRMIGEKASFGLGLPFAIQWFGADGLGSFAPFVADGVANHLTNMGTKASTGMGFKVGVQGEAAEGLTLAASYQSKISMKRYKDYEDLMAQRGKVDVPATGTIGLAYKCAPASVVAFDIQKIWYSKVPSLANPFANVYGFEAGDPTKGLGGENGIGLGWKDVTVFKLGYQAKTSEDMTWRAGISYGKEPIRASEVFFNLIAPGVNEMHYTVGATKTLKKGGEVSFSAMFAPTRKVTGYNPLEAPGQQTIQLRQGEVGLEVAYGRKL
ncbi:MAG TPA: outer membrane protein transport protein [Armatimonadota bacterium]|jgi:long-chain fatty acid transport protein